MTLAIKKYLKYLDDNKMWGEVDKSYPKGPPIMALNL